MGKFLNKRELILLVLIIVLFDLNGFCETALNHIIYGRRRHTMIFLLSVAILCYDIFIFHSIINHPPIPEIEFKPNDLHKTLTCEEELENQLETKTKQIKNTTVKCKIDETNNSNKLTETLVLNFIILILIMICVSTISIKDSEGINLRSKRLILASPIIIITSLLFIYVNIYRQFIV